VNRGRGSPVGILHVILFLGRAFYEKSRVTTHTGNRTSEKKIEGEIAVLEVYFLKELYNVGIQID
jgi:hypothetical protein